MHSVQSEFTFVVVGLHINQSFDCLTIHSAFDYIVDLGFLHSFPVRFSFSVFSLVEYYCSSHTPPLHNIILTTIAESLHHL
jgi:hypothetical protein